jgi:hypothetical protein
MRQPSASPPAETGDEPRLPIHPALLKHLDSIWHPGAAVFPVTKSRGDLYGQWQAIKAAAGIPLDGPETIDFHDLPRTCQTEWDSLLPGLGGLILGYAPNGVGESWHRNFTKKASDLCNSLPQPASFLSGLPRRPTTRTQEQPAPEAPAVENANPPEDDGETKYRLSGPIDQTEPETTEAPPPGSEA